MHSAPTLIATPLIACSRPQPMWTQRNAQPQGPDRPVGRRGGLQGKGTQAGCRAWTAPWRMGRVCEACLVWTPFASGSDNDDAITGLGCALLQTSLRAHLLSVSRARSGSQAAAIGLPLAAIALLASGRDEVTLLLPVSRRVAREWWELLCASVCVGQHACWSCPRWLRPRSGQLRCHL